jgi:hypothetical protein
VKDPATLRPTERRPEAGPTAVDLGWAALLFAAALVGFHLLQQGRLTGDGAMLVDRHVSGAGRDYPHALYLPAAEALRALVRPRDPMGAPLLLSLLGGALAVASTFLVARAFGSRRGPALFAAALLAVSPVTLFFSTTVEVHAFHAGLVGLAAVLTLLAPWRVALAGVLVVLLAWPGCFLSHRGGAFLGLGWLLLMRIGRDRVTAPLRWRTTWLVHGPLLLAWMLLALSLANLRLAGEFTPVTADQRSFVTSFLRPPGAPDMLVDGWLIPLALLLPLAALGLALRDRSLDPARDRVRRLAPLALVLPGLAYHFWWGVSERGGYFLAGSIFLAAVAARVLPRRRVAAVAIALVALLGQGLLGLRELRAHDTGMRVDERNVQIARALPEGGLLVSFHVLGPRASAWAEDVTEHRADAWFQTQLERLRGGLEVESPEAFVAASLPHLAGAVGQGPVVIDASGAGALDDPVVRQRQPYVEALVAHLEAEWTVERLDHPDWPMLRLVAAP